MNLKMNKYEEALNDLYSYLADDIVEAPFLFRSCLDTLKDYKEKYRWHDLRENQFDLPKECEPVLCISHDDGYILMSRRGNWWECWDTQDKYLPTKEVAYVYAWKYIEEFDDE